MTILDDNSYPNERHSITSFIQKYWFGYHCIFMLLFLAIPKFLDANYKFLLDPESIIPLEVSIGIFFIHLWVLLHTIADCGYVQSIAMSSLIIGVAGFCLLLMEFLPRAIKEQISEVYLLAYTLEGIIQILVAAIIIYITKKYNGH
ncbi:MAG: hypothetical protein MK212_11790 [Saprospiraceae bacterium]|nr:hypothetical protein [Saprospiraceae bacterium]